MDSAFLETQLILNALRPEQDSADWDAALHNAGADWDRIAVRSIVLGLAPLLYQKIEDWGLILPPRAAAKLGVTYKANAERNTKIYIQLSEMLAFCRTRGLNPIALKGVHLAADYYSQPALRPMNDIDLLFPPEELREVEQVLASLGYEGKCTASNKGPGVTKHTSTFNRPGSNTGGATPNPYLSTDMASIVEPHGSLEESWFGLRVDITAGARERAKQTILSEQECSVLAVEDLLLHLCVHFCFHLIMGRPALVQLVDLQVVTRNSEMDWETFVQRARAAHAQVYAFAALQLARQLVSANTDGNAMTALATGIQSGLRRRVEQLGLTEILQRTQQRPLRTIPQRIARGLHDRAEAARWAPDLRGRWRIWQTALRASRTDTGQMLLGRRQL